MRTRLPNRRRVVTHDVEMGAVAYRASIGFDAGSKPREIFLSSGKPGSHVDALLGDAAVAISVALQSGVSASAMSASIGRTGEPPEPVSAIGSALQLLAQYERG
jgi:hypothetical protein